MSYGMGVYTGLRALRSSQLALDTIGQNVANVNTPGYSRQQALLSASQPVRHANGMQIGTGVQASMIRRITDLSLLGRIRSQEGSYGSASSQQLRLQEIEGIFGEPGDSGIANLLSGFFSSTEKLQSDPADLSLRGGMLQAGQSLSEGFNQVSSRLSTIDRNTLQDVKIRANQVNSYASAIANLNLKIGEVETQGSMANDLRDQRDQYIRQISKLMDTTAIEKNNGSLDIVVGGYLLVSGAHAGEITATPTTNGRTQVTATNTNLPLTVRGGEIGGLLKIEQEKIPGINAKIDSLARNLILETNRIHSTGVPGSGPMHRLRSDNALTDVDRDGNYGDGLLSEVNLPFDISSGSLFVSTTNETTGQLTQTEILIDPDNDTVDDLTAKLNSIGNLSALVDPSGHLLLSASTGYGFDFACRLDDSPDQLGTMGGSNASITGSGVGPFDFITNGYPNFNVFIDGNGTAINVQLSATDFDNPAIATSAEVAAAIDTALGANGTARVVGGRVTVQSASSGSASSIRIDTSNAGHTTSVLNLASVTDTGANDAVVVKVGGTYTGNSNAHLRFEAAGDGQIGVTAGLQVKVYDDNNTLLATLDVGEGYEEGKLLEVANGIEVSFSHGTLSQTSGDSFNLDAMSDSDTSDLLVAFGLNSFFTGSSAADIAVADRLKDNPALLCAGLTDSSGNGSNLTRLLDMRDSDITGLGSNTVEGYYTNTIGDMGFETDRMDALSSSEEEMLGFLEDQRLSIAGVSLDEEMVEMVKYQQAYQAASRFINTVTELTTILLSIGS